MSELNTTVVRQMQQLQTLMHRMAFHGFTADGKAAHNPYRGQGKVLSLLKRQPEISQKELADLLDMSKQSLAELLGKMEKSGYISREPSTTDKRSVVIRLLPEGEKAIAEMDGSSLEVMHVFDCLEQEELARFSESLTRVIRKCTEYFPGEDFEERSRRMERFVNRFDHSFTHFVSGDKQAHHKQPCPKSGEKQNENADSCEKEQE